MPATVTPPRPQNAERTATEEVLGLFLHTAMALIGGGAVALLLGGITVRLVYFITGLELFREVVSPFYWMWVALLGFFVNILARTRSAVWIGVLGLIYMAAMIAWDFSVIRHSEYYLRLPGGPWRYEWNQLFTSKCSDSECLGELLITAPTFALISYSIGAAIALRVRRNQH